MPGTQGADVLADALRALLPDAVAVVARSIGASTPPLYPQEASAVANAVAKRQHEFAAGRAAARTAMAALGQPSVAIPSRADRAPDWPENLIGSISHTSTICVAAVAQKTRLRSLGIDLEQDANLPSDIVDMVCLPGERAALADLPPSEQGRAARAIFCAKEAFFKAQYPLTGLMIDFDTVAVTLDLEGSSFAVTPQYDIGIFTRDQQVDGQFICAADHLACTVVIGHSA